MGANETGYIGQSVRRKEDARFLTGAGQFTDDVTMARQTQAYFLRSPHAHARIRGIDTSKAKKAPGVVAIYTAPPAREIAGDVQVSIGNIESARDATSTRFRGGLSGPL